MVAELEMRYVLAVVAGAIAVVMLQMLANPVRLRLVMTIALAIGLSVGLSISFLHHIKTPGSHVLFAGGAQAVTISLAMLATVGYFAADIVARSFFESRRPLVAAPHAVVPQLMFMLAGILSLANAHDATLVWLEEWRLFTLLLATLMTMNLTKRELRVFLVTVAGTVIAQSGLAWVQFGTGRSLGLGAFGEAAPIVTGIDYGKVARPTGTLGDPNILSYFFEITAPVMLALFYTERRWMKLLFAIATLAAIAGAVATYSRAAWVTIPLALVFVTIVIGGRQLISLRNAFVALLLCAFLVVALVYAWPLLEKRLFGDDAGSFGRRLPLALAALSMLEKFPLFGVGLNNFAVSFNRYDDTHYSRIFRGGDHVVHNLHLLTWTEVGTIGFVAYLSIFGMVFYMASRVKGRGQERALAMGGTAGLVAHMIHGMVDPGFKLSLTISYLVFAQIGIITRSFLEYQKRHVAERSRQRETSGRSLPEMRNHPALRRRH